MARTFFPAGAIALFGGAAAATQTKVKVLDYNPDRPGARYSIEFIEEGFGYKPGDKRNCRASDLAPAPEAERGVEYLASAAGGRAPSALLVRGEGKAYASASELSRAEIAARKAGDPEAVARALAAPGSAPSGAGLADALKGLDPEALAALGAPVPPPAEQPVAEPAPVEEPVAEPAAEAAAEQPVEEPAAETAVEEPAKPKKGGKKGGSRKGRK